ncbi:Hemolysin-type calcium-binding region:Alkaline phosphatase:Metallophosphoesterase:Putative Ig [gamma proteobacterium IMCC1989]|nr:Hemolysin-type calcium-binding region:Alkaline phosphatase:Metallophosphoesterase:Putative Ig [gamma proteobacterium IMCC1989]
MRVTADDANGGEASDDFILAVNSERHQQYGNNDNDSLVGSHVADALYGLSGNDTLKGDDGNDILVGGADNDLMYGNTGDDIYEFGGDFDDDRISNHGGYYDTDRAVFTDVNADQLWFSQSNNDLLINTYNDAGELTDNSVAIRNWYDLHRTVDEFSAGGELLLDSQVALLVQAMASVSTTGVPSDLNTLSQEERESVQLAVDNAWG